MFYTYVHLEGKEIVYVGFGHKNRQFDKKYRRSNKHAEWIAVMLNKVGQSYSKVIKYFNEESDARYFERLMIKKYQPRFNKQHTKAYTRPDVSIRLSKQIGEKHPMFGKKRPDLSAMNTKRSGIKHPMSWLNRLKRQKALEKNEGR